MMDCVCVCETFNHFVCISNYSQYFCVIITALFIKSTSVAVSDNLLIHLIINYY